MLITLTITILIITISFTNAENKMVIGTDSISFDKNCDNGRCSSKILNPILDLAFPNTTFIWTNDLEPDLVIRSPFREKNRKCYTCPYINLSGEPYKIEHKEYPPILEINSYIDFESQHENNGIHKEFYIPHILNSNYELPHIRKYTNLNRPYLIAYMNSNCQPHREYMFKILVNIFGEDKVHALGKCSNNKKIELSSWETAYDIYKNYTFVFAMENTNLFGYITEKIMNSYIAGSIPIYWGSEGKIIDFFNKIFTYIITSINNTTSYK